QRFHAVGAREQLIPFIGRVFERGARAGRATVIVQRPAVNRVQLVRAFGGHAVEEAARPVDVAAVRPGGDVFEVDAVARRPGDEAAEFSRVFSRRKAAPAAPRFVADPPELDVEWVTVAGGGAQVRESGSARRGVAVFDPFVEIFGRQAAQ